MIRRAGDSETPGQPATPASPRNREHDTASVVEAAASGEAWAWAQLVRWYEPRIRQIARSYRLSESDAGDVAQIVWIRLLENITRLRNPANVGAWLATTARRECLQLLAVHKRTTPVAQDDDMFTTVTDHTLPDPADGLIRDEAAAVVHAALGQLPARWRQLLQMLMENETPNYYEISDQLDMPVGSIGPTRGRALQRLRGMLEPANVA